MTLPEWTTHIRSKLEAHGFTVEEHQGFPLVRCPKTMEETIRLLELPVGAEKTIYAEGMLFLPPGSGAMRR